MKTLVVLALLGALATAVELPELLRVPPRRDVRKIPHPPHVRNLTVADFHVKLSLAESKDDALKRAAKTLEDSIDESVNPCEDFRAYACGNYKGSSTFADVSVSNTVKQIAELRRKDSSKTLGPLKQVKSFWNACVKAINNIGNTLRGATYVKKLVDDFEKKTGFGFPLVKGAPNKKLTATEFAKAIGYLSNQHADTTPLVQTFIFSKLTEPQNGYRLYLDGPFGIINPVFLQDPLYEVYKEQIVSLFEEPLLVYAEATGANDDDVGEVALQLAEFERALAQGALDSPGLPDIENKYSAYTAGFAFNNTFDFKTYLAALAGDDQELATMFSRTTYEFAIASPSNWKKWTAALAARKNKDGSDISDATILNYIVFRIIFAKRAFLGDAAIKGLPQASPETRFARHIERPFGVPEPSLQRAEFEIPEWHPLMRAAAITRAEVTCAQLSGSYLEFANDRVFLSSVYPEDRREATQAGVSEMADLIAKEMKGMLRDLDWMSDESKKAANNKVNNIQKNILWPAIVYNDSALVDFYKPLPELSKLSWLEQMAALDTFVRAKELHQLTAKSYDRSEFGDTSVVNAYYRPNANSITILAAISQAPFYDVDWPAAMQYGAIGMAVGHEITHGFDNGGVFWDGVGALKPDTWMDKKSRQAFDNMAKCVIDEYNGLCLPSDVAEDGEICDNGENTQGENIADNGGIRSGNRAYKAYEKKHGASPKLPGKLGSASSDKLFFLSFARTWCDNVADNSQYPWENEHSPAPLRIFGTLQNYERFRDTFNCPVGAPYAPAKHCNVWYSPPKKNNDRAKFAAVNKIKQG